MQNIQHVTEEINRTTEVVQIMHLVPEDDQPFASITSGKEIFITNTITPQYIKSNTEKGEKITRTSRKTIDTSIIVEKTSLQMSRNCLMK